VAAKRPDIKTTRVQLHLGENTVERLNVHCSLAHVNNSREADRILRQWLLTHGRGKAAFADGPEGADPAGEVESAV
jgi:hypothetical protein